MLCSPTPAGLTAGLQALPPLRQRQCRAFSLELDQGWIGVVGVSGVLFKLWLLMESLAGWILLCVNTAWTSRTVVASDYGSISQKWVVLPFWLPLLLSRSHECHHTVPSYLKLFTVDSHCMIWKVPRDCMMHFHFQGSPYKTGAWSERETGKLLILHFLTVGQAADGVCLSGCVSRGWLWSDKPCLARALAAEGDIHVRASEMAERTCISEQCLKYRRWCRGLYIFFFIIIVFIITPPALCLPCPRLPSAWPLISVQVLLRFSISNPCALDWVMWMLVSLNHRVFVWSWWWSRTAALLRFGR